MKQTLAFTDCTESKSEAMASARRHVELDMLIQGTYGKDRDDGKGCSIGCHYHGDHAQGPAKHGFSVKFVYLCDRMFEAHKTSNEAAEFHVWVMDNVPKGIDTDKIWWEFFALTIDRLGEDWAEFSKECRTETPNIDRLKTIALDLARASASASALARALDLALARASASARALDLALARASASASALARALDLALALALPLALALALARDINNFKKAVKTVATKM